MDLTRWAIGPLKVIERAARGFDESLQSRLADLIARSDPETNRRERDALDRIEHGRFDDGLTADELRDRWETERKKFA